MIHGCPCSNVQNCASVSICRPCLWPNSSWVLPQECSSFPRALSGPVLCAIFLTGNWSLVQSSWMSSPHTILASSSSCWRRCPLGCVASHSASIGWALCQACRKDALPILVALKVLCHSHSNLLGVMYAVSTQCVLVEVGWVPGVA